MAEILKDCVGEGRLYAAALTSMFEAIVGSILESDRQGTLKLAKESMEMFTKLNNKVGVSIAEVIKEDIDKNFELIPRKKAEFPRLGSLSLKLPNQDC
jgi:hypothetical protein